MKSLVISSGVRNVEILLEAVVSSPSVHRLNQHIISTCFFSLRSTNIFPMSNLVLLLYLVTKKS